MSNLKILVVDDEPVFLELMAHMLARAGYREVEFAQSAEEALEAIDRPLARFDCFLLDIQMDGMNGVELCTRIRAMQPYARTPIVMITAMTEKHYVDAAFLAGANDFVNKPIDLREVRARMGMVEAILSERSQLSMVSSQLVDTEAVVGARVSFDSATILEDCDFLAPASRLEAHLLRQGTLRLLSSVAVGFHVENARALHERAPGLPFADLMAEVGYAIREAISGGDRILSYFGRGDFCAMLPQTTPFDRQEVEAAIELKLAQIPGLAFDGPGMMPVVKVGAPKRNGLRLLGDATWMLYAAMAGARGEDRTTKKEVIANVA